MTDSIYKGDDEKLLGDESPKNPDTVEEHCLWITGLTKAQFDALQVAVRPDPRNRTAKFIGKVTGLAAMMVFVAACIWTVTWLLTPLTNR